MVVRATGCINYKLVCNVVYLLILSAICRENTGRASNKHNVRLKDVISKQKITRYNIFAKKKGGIVMIYIKIK